MRILYVNMRSAWTTKGHKLFDMRWVALLSKIASVDVIAPSDDWYHTVPARVNILVCHKQKKVQNSKILSCRLFQTGIMKRLSVKDHTEAHTVFRYVKRLDKVNKYDAIIASTYDVIDLALCTLYVSDFHKFYLIEHMPNGYEKESLRWFFQRIKNRMKHICMEKQGKEYLCSRHGVDAGLVFYIPHPLNEAAVYRQAEFEACDVAGIANSNDPLEILKIIDEEKKNHFFEKNHIKAIFRTKDTVFDNGWLRVIKGNVNLSFDQYYNYILKSKIVVLCYPKDFGIRTSGTIIDAFSNDKPVIGTGFQTLRQYKKDYPDICYEYDKIEDLQEAILFLLKNTMEKSVSFIEFKNARQDEKIVEMMEKVFGSDLADM